MSTLATEKTPKNPKNFHVIFVISLRQTKKFLNDMFLPKNTKWVIVNKNQQNYPT